MKKYKFTDPGCWSCPSHQLQGTGLCETRYCMGFPNKKKAKRFRCSDPRFKAPKWCPKRLAPPVCRVYRPAGEEAQAREGIRRLAFGDEKGENYYPTAVYRLVRTFPLGMDAKTFYESVMENHMEQVIGLDVDYGDVIEIDNGLQVVSFYYFNYSTVLRLNLPVRKTESGSIC